MGLGCRHLPSLNWALVTQVNDDQSPSTLNYLVHLQERPVKQTISR